MPHLTGTADPTESGTNLRAGYCRISPDSVGPDASITRALHARYPRRIRVVSARHHDARKTDTDDDDNYYDYDNDYNNTSNSNSNTSSRPKKSISRPPASTRA